jgi:hypothetical protein
VIHATTLTLPPIKDSTKLSDLTPLCGAHPQDPVTLGGIGNAEIYET